MYFRVGSATCQTTVVLTRAEREEREEEVFVLVCMSERERERKRKRKRKRSRERERQTEREREHAHTAHRQRLSVTRHVMFPFFTLLSLSLSLQMSTVLRHRSGFMQCGLASQQLLEVVGQEYRRTKEFIMLVEHF